MKKEHSKSEQILRLRKLLPRHTKGMQDENVAFMASRLEDVADEELEVAWEKEYDSHLQEMASFLYGMYKEHKTRGLTDEDI